MISFILLFVLSLTSAIHGDAKARKDHRVRREAAQTVDCSSLRDGALHDLMSMRDQVNLFYLAIQCAHLIVPYEFRAIGFPQAPRGEKTGDKLIPLIQAPLPGVPGAPGNPPLDQSGSGSNNQGAKPKPTPGLPVTPKPTPKPLPTEGATTIAIVTTSGNIASTAGPTNAPSTDSGTTAKSVSTEKSTMAESGQGTTQASTKMDEKPTTGAGTEDETTQMATQSVTMATDSVTDFQSNGPDRTTDGTDLTTGGTDSPTGVTDSIDESSVSTTNVIGAATDQTTGEVTEMSSASTT